MTTITDIVKRAAAAFILLTFTLSKKSYKFQLPKPVAQKIASQIAAAEKISRDGTHCGKIVAMDIAVPAFGPHQKTYNDLILKRLGQFRNNEVSGCLRLTRHGQYPRSNSRLNFPGLRRCVTRSIPTLSW